MIGTCVKQHMHKWMHFVNLWPLPFNLIFSGGWGIVMDYPFAKFDDHIT